MKSVYRYLDDLSHHKHIYLILFSLALLTRFVGLILGGDRAGDDGVYLHAAQEILNGNGLRYNMGDLGFYRSWLPPGMAVVRATFLYLFTNDVIPMMIFFTGMSIFTTVLFFQLCKRLLPNRYALLATLLWIFYPPQWFWASRSNPHTYAYNMMIICFYLLFVTWERKSLWIPFGTGILWASASLMRGEYLPGILVLCFATLFINQSKDFKLKVCLMLFLGCAIGLAPWVIRNYKWHNKILILATAGADNFWFSYNPKAKFSGDEISMPPEFKEYLRTFDTEIERAAVIKKETLKYIKENPRRAVFLFCGNILNYWRPWLSTRDTPLHENVVYVVSYVPIFILFLFGLRFVPYKEPHWVLIIGFLLYKMLIHIPFYIIVRFREMTLPLMLIVAALALQKIIDQWEQES